MLNRRDLRIKAMQAIYAHHFSMDALKQEMGKDLSGKYDPKAPEDQDLLTEWRSTISSTREKIKANYIKSLDNPEVELGVEGLIYEFEEYKALFEEKEKKLLKYSKGKLMMDVASIHTSYLKLLALLNEISFVEKREKHKASRASLMLDHNFHFVENKLLDDLSSFSELTELLENKSISWSNDIVTIKYWYKELISKNDQIISYQNQNFLNLEEQYKVVRYLTKNILFKAQKIDDFMSLNDLHWFDNKPILRKMVLKTLKDYMESGKFELKSLSVNKEEDLEYLEKLFVFTISNGDSLKPLIAEKANNWDISRIALIDMIIIKMAITEMIQFPSIPIKVTINEFIEISKRYSTPKSKQFINGILDVLSNQLSSNGTIRKSGRGLIDNS